MSSGDDSGGGVPSMISCGDGAAGEDCILTTSDGTGDKLIELFLLRSCTGVESSRIVRDDDLDLLCWCVAAAAA